MSERQKARKVKAVQQHPQIVRYADGLIALGTALKNPQTSIRELARLSLAVDPVSYTHLTLPTNREV